MGLYVEAIKVLDEFIADPRRKAMRQFGSDSEQNRSKILSTEGPEIAEDRAKVSVLFNLEDNDLTADQLFDILWYLRNSYMMLFYGKACTKILDDNSRAAFVQSLYQDVIYYTPLYMKLWLQSDGYDVDPSLGHRDPIAEGGLSAEPISGLHDKFKEGYFELVQKEDFSDYFERYIFSFLRERFTNFDVYSLLAFPLGGERYFQVTPRGFNHVIYLLLVCDNHFKSTVDKIVAELGIEPWSISHSAWFLLIYKENRDSRRFDRELIKRHLDFLNTYFGPNKLTFREKRLVNRRFSKSHRLHDYASSLHGERLEMLAKCVWFADIAQFFKYDYHPLPKWLRIIGGIFAQN